MNHIFVGLIASLAFVALTQAATLFEYRENSAMCPLPKVCGKRKDGFCQTFTHSCQMNHTNCYVNNEESRKWTEANIKECSRLTGTNTIGVCDSSCTATTKCTSTPADIKCGANKDGTECKVYPNLCDLTADACKKKDVFPAVQRRCADANLVTVGQQGKCAPKHPEGTVV